MISVSWKDSSCRYAHDNLLVWVKLEILERKSKKIKLKKNFLKNLEREKSRYRE